MGIKWLERFSARLFKASRDFLMYSTKENVGEQFIKGEINPVFAWYYIRGKPGENEYLKDCLKIHA